MSKKIQLTKEGLETLKNELESLKNEKRVEIAEKLKVAIGYGDLSENSEYQDARDEQAAVELRISELEDQLSNYELITVSTSKSKKKEVNIGSSVTIEMTQDGKKTKKTFHIVGSMETDIFEDKISNESPVGRAMIGKTIGEKVEGQSHAGKFSYKIVDVA